MTYCVGLRLDQGIVFASDTRTNAGLDDLGTFTKMHVWERKGDRVIVLMSAGNLAFTQSIISLLNERMHAGPEGKEPSFFSVTTMFQAARVVGATIREAREHEKAVSEDSPGVVSGTFILGGQIHGEPPRLFHIYKEGNFIEATKDTAYFQIGEHKYGKPILDRVAKPEMRMPVAAKLLLISFNSTLRSNLSVGMPIDMLIYYRDTLEVTDQRRIEEKDPNFRKISQGWSQALRDAFAHIDDYGGDADHAGSRRAMPTNVAETPEAAYDQLLAGTPVQRDLAS